ncbi:cytochrome c oxidase assembly protein subunit 15 [Aeromicrobium panaciterrae]|uniref:Cytochrome c oxidase assembly protein subunit 15 n=1 Tax=Aeromicrobium panaciterrae TaxID=363861 RepID=A0ABU1UP87_9ACTN|nr:COX15/CtaA family protein [Aeromicrobium panaciterrae]MDR7086994.1 cytochrome c oxidase assembly protein subunit 15 [Aeromicrobium panaciterrae]
MGVTLGIRNPDRTSVELWAWATLAANTLIVLTGGLVRLTGSGLGCPTWPKCTDDSFVPHRALGTHGVIEFGNRMLTYVLVFVVISALIAVWRWSRSTQTTRRLALIIALGVPFQAVIGGISVLTDLNPWVVSLHLILSMGLIAASTVLLVKVRGGLAGSRSHVTNVIATYAVVWVVVYLGTIVTGSGPHAGDTDAPRNGLDPQVMSHVHAVSVYVLVALTILLAIVARGPMRRLAVILLGVELAQGTIGFVQYFTDLPIALVAAHLVGAAVLVAAATRLLLEATATESAAPPQARP